MEEYRSFTQCGNSENELLLKTILVKCSSYLNKIETYHQNLSRMTVRCKMDELCNMIRNREEIDKIADDFFSTCDTLFLTSYPNFVREVNDLLYKDKKICPRVPQLMNTELRILALIWLGVTDNQRLAKLLHSSVNTVYTYRSRLRLKSPYKEDFEFMVSHIDRNASPTEKNKEEDGIFKCIINL